MLIPLATLATILPLKHDDPAFVSVAEQDAIRQQLMEWLSEENPVLINGQTVSPEFPRIDFYSLNLSDFANRPEAEPVSMASGRIGVIMSYPAEDDFVREASVSWNKFYSAVTRIPAVVVTPAGELQRFEFSRFNEAEDNVFAWQCPEEMLPQSPTAVAAVLPADHRLPISLSGLVLLILTLPAALIAGRRRRLLVAAGMLALAGICWSTETTLVTVQNPLRPPDELSAEEAGRVLQQLHSGMYLSLSFGSESRIYDALAAGIDGPLLEELYLQLLETLRVREQGGAVARVQEVSMDSPAKLERSAAAAAVAWPGFQCEATWTVAGTVEHWGHIHERRNRFDAVFSVEPRDGHWKITAMEIQGQKQESARTTLRKF